RGAIDVGLDYQTVGTGLFTEMIPWFALNPLSTCSALSTTITHDSTTGLFLDKVLKKQPSASENRVLVNAFQRLSPIWDRVHLSKNVVEAITHFHS
ncbi:unnamed protein product, partial [Allacma fusca]